MALAAALVVAAPLAGRADPATRGDHPPGPASPTSASTSAQGRSGAPHTTGLRVVSVPLADPSVADVLAPGDLVDLVGTAAEVLDPVPADPVPADPVPADAPDAGASPTGPRHGIEIVARAARVREVPLGRAGSRSILVEVPEIEAAPLAATAAVTPLAVVVHG